MKILLFFLFGVQMTHGGEMKSESSRVVAHALRFKPGQDFTKELMSWAKKRKIKAASIVSAVGSFKELSLRFANQEKARQSSGHFEIVSLSGTFNQDGMHVHGSFADETGKTIGGHIMEGNKVYTTVELVLQEYPEIQFVRELDQESGYHELGVKRVK